MRCAFQCTSWLVVACGALFCVAAQADDVVTKQEAALRVIRATAADICTTVPTEGSDQGAELSGNAKAKLDGGIGKIVGLGVEGAVKYQQSEYKGVLRADLTKAIQTGNDCKLSVFNTLVSKMLPSPPSSPAPAEVSEFKKPEGSFKKMGGSWVEYPPYAPGQYLTFQELSRDATFVYLVDPSRTKPGDSHNRMLVRLPLVGGPAEWSYENPIVWSQFTVVDPVR
jgi:hypothetical protein